MVVGGVVGAGVTATVLAKKKNDDEDDTTEAGDGGGSNNQSRSRVRGSFHKEVSQLATNVTNFDNITHVNFLSDIMARLWPYINQAGCDMMRSTMEPMFAEMMPGPFKSIKFTKLDLGETPMVIDNIIVHQLQDGCVKFDWDITWDSSSDIQLSGKYGINFGVKSIQLAGRMSFLLNPLSNVIPCVDAIQYAFVNPPQLELDFTGLANIADFSIIDKTIRQIMQDVLAGMMVLPIRKVYKMNAATNLWDLHKPVMGVARVTLLKGRGFQIEKRGLLKDDVPDVYCKMKLGAGNGRAGDDDDEWQTSTIKNSCNPDWTIDGSKKQSKDFLLADLDQILQIEAFDEDQGVGDSDDFLGRCKVVVGQILLAGSTMEVELAHEEKDGNYFKSTGCFVTISVDILPFTTDDLSSLQKAGRPKLTKQVITPENQLAGNLTVLITKAFDIPLPKKDAATFVKVMYGSETEIGVTGVVTDAPGYDAINPLYESSFHLPLKPLGTEGHTQLQPVKMQLINGEDTVLGEIVIKPDDLLKASKGKIQETRKIGKGGASLEFYISLAGVRNNDDNKSTRTSMTASPTAASTSVKPRSFDDGGNETEESSNRTTTTNASAAVTGLDMEQVQVSIVKGYGFKVKKTPFFKKDDIPDVYCVVKFGSNPQTWKTKTIKDSVAPVWNENKDYVLSSPNQVIHVGVFEANSKTKDDYYGNIRVAVGKVLLNGGSMDLEITHEGKKTGKFVTVGCQKI